MDIDQELKCNQCLESFGFNKTPLIMPHCTHNVCQKCFDEVKESKLDIIQCGFCGSTMVQCKSRKLQTNRGIKDKISPDTKNYQKYSPHHEPQYKINSNQDTDILLIGDEFSNKKKSSGLPKEKQSVLQLCSAHEKPLQIICLTDLKRICPHCAIFGNHKDHKFKSLKEFDNDFNENMKTIQMIKEKKYKLDKKMKTWEQNDMIMKKLRFKKEDLGREIEKKFEILIKNIRDLRDKTMDDLANAFITTEKRIYEIMQDQNREQNKFSNWESQCENLLSKVNQNISLNEKITIMYGPLMKIKEGQALINQKQKKLDLINQKIDDKINSIRVDFSKNFNITNIAKVYISNQQPKRENFLQMIEKVNNPMSKHIIDEVADFSDNSFICDYSREDLSAFIDDSDKVKTPLKKEKSSILNQTLKFSSPDTKDLKKRLIRSRSNNASKMHLFDSTAEKRSRQSKILETTEIRNPDTIVADFLKQDLREVLDLSQCNLTDQMAYKYVKDVRRHRKIRGLKLNKNALTDNGFLAMLQLFNSTSNLNLSNNQLTQECLKTIVLNKQKFSPLRMINISMNKVNQKKAKGKIQEIKRLGITVTL